MAIGWKAVAVTVASLIWSMPATAQQFVAPGEPVPIATYGPIPSAGSPVAPGAAVSPLTLTDDGTPNAFEEEWDPYWENLIYISAGTMALKRNGIGGLPFVREDLIPLDRTTDPANGAILLGFSDLPTERYDWGVRAAAGVHNAGLAIELNGFWVGSLTSSASVARPNGLNVTFGNFDSPLGFVGNNNLWRQADAVQVSLQTRLGNAELLMRNATSAGFEFLGGIRYVDMYERFSIFTDDDSLALGATNPLRQADYKVRTQNRIVGPVFGFEYVNDNIVPFFAFGLSAKASIGPNFAERRLNLTRGDGKGFFPGRDQTTQFSQVYEIGGFVEFVYNEHLRIRGGYQALWLLTVYEAAEQVNFDPAVVNLSPAELGNVFFHGPMVEVRIQF